MDDLWKIVVAALLVPPGVGVLIERRLTRRRQRGPKLEVRRLGEPAIALHYRPDGLIAINDVVVHGLSAEGSIETWLALNDFVDATRRSAATSEGVHTGSLYLSTTDVALAEALFATFVEALASADVEVVADGPPVVGSWFQRFKLSLRRAAHSPAVADGVEKGLHAAETAALRAPMSQVNVNQADAIARLAAAAAPVDEFIAVTDGVVLVKATAPNGRTRTVARTLTVKQIRDLERRPQLTVDPAAMLRYFLESPEPDEPGTELPETSNE